MTKESSGAESDKAKGLIQPSRCCTIKLEEQHFKQNLIAPYKLYVSTVALRVTGSIPARDKYLHGLQVGSCSGSGCLCMCFFYVCKRTHDTGIIPN